MRRGRSVSASLVAAFGIVLLFACAASAQMAYEDPEWAAYQRIPANVKAQFRIGDFGSGLFAFVWVFWMTPLTLAELPGYSEDAAPAFWALVHNTFGEREVLAVFVQPVRVGYWWPTDLAFLQGTTQYDVGYGDCATLEGTFSGQLLARTTTIGAVAIPARVDITKPFVLYYDGVMKGEMGPLTPGT